MSQYRILPEVEPLGIKWMRHEQVLDLPDRPSRLIVVERGHGTDWMIAVGACSDSGFTVDEVLKGQSHAGKIWFSDFVWAADLSDWEDWFTRFLVAQKKLATDIVFEIARVNGFSGPREMFASGARPSGVKFGCELSPRSAGGIESSLNTVLVLASLLYCPGGQQNKQFRSAILEGFRAAGWNSQDCLVSATDACVAGFIQCAWESTGIA